MEKLFGTDGIRGVANRHPITPEVAVAIGRAVATYFDQKDRSRRFVIGKDTRLSGDMLVSALGAGICAMGAGVLTVDVMPTPGVAFLTRQLNAAAGIVVSASHNPYGDNGIKLFNGDGFKLSDEVEAEVEKLIHDFLTCPSDFSNLPPAHGTDSVPDPGRIECVADADERYAEFLRATLPDGFNLNGMKIAIDCANGATYKVAIRLLALLGAEVIPLYVSPDGRNINVDCGSQHTGTLCETVCSQKAVLGLAFDGDGDRMVAVDETGGVVTGDRVLAICTRDLKARNLLRNNLVVSTVMSNLGLRQTLEEMDVKHIMTDVGDRYVMSRMVAEGSVLGGEDSGHMIFLAHHTTGDGLLTALQLLVAIQNAGQPLSRLAALMPVYPQELINVTVRSQPALETVAEIATAIKSVEARLGDQGRVLVRYSGTQPKCRIMVEGADKVRTRRYCQEIADIVKTVLG